jgi:hypothetical protein
LINDIVLRLRLLRLRRVTEVRLLRPNVLVLARLWWLVLSLMRRLQLVDLPRDLALQRVTVRVV